jgi:DNA sulfur modification protein DndD
MEVLIRGWRARNLRGALRDLEIDLGESPVRWTLIQMANGMGKTTTMALLRAVFSGAALPPTVVQDLRAGDDVESGDFEVRLLIDGKPYRLGLDFDFRDGSVSRYTVRADTRDGGRVSGRALPPELADLLTPDLTKMFVFDGEMAKSIRDMKRQTADDAIRALYRLNEVAGLRSTITQLVELEQKRSAALTLAKEDKGVTRLRNARNEAQAVKQRLEAERQTVSDRLTTRQSDAARLNAAIDARLHEDEGLKQRFDDLKRRQQELVDETNQLSGEALAILRRPPHVHPRLLERLRFLGDRLFDLKLPETISAEFFRDLADEAKCVCGRPIGEHERTYILTQSHRYLAQDQISVINQMKLALRESSGDPEQFSKKVANLQAKLRERQRLKAERDRLEMERIDKGDDALEKLRADLDACNEELGRLEQQFERLTTQDTPRRQQLRLSWESNLPLCDAELKARQDRLDAATHTRKFARKADLMSELIKDFGVRALANLRERVRERTNEKLAQISKTEQLQVTRIAGGLEIASPGLGAKSDVSEGQSLSVAYAFLTSLLSDAPHRLPFVVDSPSVSLDVDGRREVGERIPEFFDQMIMLVISTEREGFAESFYGRGDDVRYLTISRVDGQVKIDEGLQPFQAFQEREAA